MQERAIPRHGAVVVGPDRSRVVESESAALRVVVSAVGRFHSFELAAQLESRDMLQTLLTGYPSWKVYEVSRDRVRAHPRFEPLHHLFSRLGARRAARLAASIGAVEYDSWVARTMLPADVFVSLSSFAVKSFRRASELGAVTVCDRGSSHIAYQAEILREEYRRFGVMQDPMDDRIIRRELIEYEEADYITVPSEFVRRSFLERGVPAEKLVKVPYGVDLSVYRPLPKRDSTFRVLFVGTASLRKGIQYLLEALAPLDLANFEIVLVGHVAPSARKVLARYEGRFRRVGFIPRLELAGTYSQGSVLVLPSVEEGLALVQAQAMACGLPVIATTNTGAEDLFSDGEEGLILPPRDVVAIREAVLKLYHNPDLREHMARRALERVQSIGGWSDYGTRAACAFLAMHAARSDRRQSNPAEAWAPVR